MENTEMMKWQLCVQDTVKEIGIDDSHCRRYEGENGFALVTLKETDRVFLSSNKGGIAKEHDFGYLSISKVFILFTQI